MDKITRTILPAVLALTAWISLTPTPIQAQEIPYAGLSPQGTPDFIALAVLSIALLVWGAVRWRLGHWHKRGRDHLAPEDLAAEEAEGGAGEEAAERPTVLVVEDDVEMSAYLHRLLARRFRVLEAPDGSSGIEQAFSASPDLVLTDIVMPQAGGFNLVRALAGDRRTDHIPIVALTARGCLEHRIQSLESGFDAYLAKPFHPREVFACLENLIAGRERLRKRFARRIRLEGTAVEACSADEKLLRRVLECAEENLQDPRFGVFELAESVGMSSRHLRRKLLALTEESPSALLRRLRLEKAQQLLEQGAGNVSEVALAVGIPKPARFSEVFREAYGAPPSSFLRGC